MFASISLAIYVWVLLKKIRISKNIQQQTLEKHAASAQKHKKYLIDSIRIISRSVAEKQCPMTEGCIRLKVLIDNYSPHLHQEKELQIIEMMYSKTSHIPTLEGWKKIHSTERLQYQNEMEALEKEHADSILKAADFLKDYPFEQRVH